MAKKGMHRAYDNQPEVKNETAPVPEIQGKAKSKKEKARPIIAGTESADMKVYHSKPHSEHKISNAFSEIDTDLARDNLENDIPFADQQDL